MNRISILMYHQLGDFPPVKLHQASYTNLSRFRAQLAFLRRWGATVMSMSDAARALRGEMPVPPKAVVLTFDDGYRSFIDHAVPLLAQYGYPAIVYVLAQRAGATADWYAADALPRKSVRQPDGVGRLVWKLYTKNPLKGRELRRSPAAAGHVA